MPLDEYRKKRDFSKTPEPAGEAAAARRRRRPLLLRAEAPRQPSALRPASRARRRAAVVGGAQGAVARLPRQAPGDADRGSSVRLRLVRRASSRKATAPASSCCGTSARGRPSRRTSMRRSSKGDLKFRLDGYKLKGSWVLVRTRGYGDSSKPSWLLIKHKDEWSGPIDITEFAPLSVKTPGADFADILAADTPGRVAQQPAGQGRRHRQAVPADHRHRARAAREAPHRCAGPADVSGEGRRAAGGARSRPGEASPQRRTRAPGCSREDRPVRNRGRASKSANSAKSAKSTKKKSPGASR